MANFLECEFGRERGVALIEASVVIPVFLCVVLSILLLFQLSINYMVVETVITTAGQKVSVNLEDTVGYEEQIDELNVFVASQLKPYGLVANKVILNADPKSKISNIQVDINNPCEICKLTPFSWLSKPRRFTSEFVSGS